MNTQLPYNEKDKYSILEYASKLKDQSLKNVLDLEKSNSINLNNGKGGFGNLVEELYFKYKPNSEAQADFPEAGIELKTTPLKQTVKGLVSKERLVFNIINYMEEHQKQFATSSFWKKNKELLLLFYLHEQDKLPIDYLFKIIRLWRFPANDLKIIIDDWNTIVNKIRAGKAHELSEGDTLYLGACTKGANKSSMRQQPFSNEPAMQRAFSLKSKYLNFIIEQSFANIEHTIDEAEYDYLLSETSMLREEYEAYKKLNLKETEPVVKSIYDYKDGQTFEDLVVDKFNAYIGFSENDLIHYFQLTINPKAKNRYQVFANRMMGVKGKYIEEFEKADVLMKTVVLENNGNLKESMSFQQIKYKEIIFENWLESYWYHTLTKRFFFIVFQKDEKGIPRLKNVKFWTMPAQDLAVAKAFWLDTQEKVIIGSFENFIKISDDKICHVRPKARDASDLAETISGKMEKKKAYWLNSGYIKKIIK